MTTKDKATLQTAFKELRAFLEAVLAYTGPETVRLNGAVCKQGDDAQTLRYWLQDNGEVTMTTDVSYRHSAV